MNDITNKITSSSTKDTKSNTNSSIDYVVLSLDEKEYYKLNPNEKKDLIRKENLNISDYCTNCNIDLDLYKQSYSVKNPDIYEKKNVEPAKRYSEYFYIYSQCRLCDDKKRVGNGIYHENLPEEKKSQSFIYKIISKIFS